VSELHPPLNSLVHGHGSCVMHFRVIGGLFMNNIIYTNWFNYRPNYLFELLSTFEYF
jgi:hypothetical protein